MIKDKNILYNNTNILNKIKCINNMCFKNNTITKDNVNQNLDLNYNYYNSNELSVKKLDYNIKNRKSFIRKLDLLNKENFNILNNTNSEIINK